LKIIGGANSLVSLGFAAALGQAWVLPPNFHGLVVSVALTWEAPEKNIEDSASPF
jgi:hypothetical protein